MAYHGAVYLTDRDAERAEAVDECNKRSNNMQHRFSRMLVKYGLATAVGSKSPAADLYYAAVAVLIEAGTVTKLVRRRDLRKGYYGAEKPVKPFRDPYWQLKLKCTCLWVPDDAADAATARTRPTDPHSGLRLENQLEVLRHARAVGVDSLTFPDWAVHRDRGVLDDVAERLRHANPPVATKLQAEIVILVDIAAGRMTTDGAIPDDRTPQSLRHGSLALPPHVDGLSPEQCGVLAALRDGARMWRQWPERESVAFRRATHSTVWLPKKRRRTGAARHVGRPSTTRSRKRRWRSRESRPAPRTPATASSGCASKSSCAEPSPTRRCGGSAPRAAATAAAANARRPSTRPTRRRAKSLASSAACVAATSMTGRAACSTRR